MKIRFTTENIHLNMLMPPCRVLSLTRADIPADRFLLIQLCALIKKSVNTGLKNTQTVNLDYLGKGREENNGKMTGTLRVGKRTEETCEHFLSSNNHIFWIELIGCCDKSQFAIPRCFNSK